MGGTGSGDVAILCRRGHVSQLPPSVSSDDSCHCHHRRTCLHAVPHAPLPEPPPSALPATPARTPVMERMNASAELLKELRIDRKSPPTASGGSGGGRRWLWIAIIVGVLLIAAAIAFLRAAPAVRCSTPAATWWPGAWPRSRPRSPARCAR
ncbi:hypothetical protein G6F65_019186 [Rhizopus arrhizus]|nr:hypothetical protein G6F65_019186 [Rhizopus arrhizus]